MNFRKTALAKSLLALLLCVAMLVSTTFAWFTDSVTSSRNVIATGTLDVELYHSNGAVNNEPVDESTELFLDLQGNPILWEPGVVSYENLRIVNEGSLALVYQLALNVANENYIIDGGNQFGLSQVLKVGVVEDGITATTREGVIAAVSSWTKLENLLRGGSLLADDEHNEKTWGIVIYWQPTASDNNWNANNGKQLSSGDALSIELGIHLTATQMSYENDSFGDDYDISAKDDIFPSFGGGTASAPVSVDANGLTTAAVEIAIGDITAIVPAGVKVKDGVSSLSLSIQTLNTTSANIVLGEDEALRSMDVHIEGVAADNTAPIIVTLPEVAPKGLNLGNYKLYHVENGATNEMTLVASNADFSAHNQFKYDPATGDMVLNMATFSEVALTAKPPVWEGKFDYTWYDADAKNLTIANADQLAAFGAIVGGMKKVTGRVDNKYTYIEDVIQDSFKGQTITLIADIDLGDAEAKNNPNLIFYPIGYNSSDGKYEKTGVAVTTGFYNFCGTFDGNGHTISNFYHNTWEMKGDNNYYDATLQYYRDGMGLFGKVYGGTIKNLTVDNFSSDGEYTTTGVVAAYADGATFENIAITNCNPRVYNIGNGGIVGCVGWYATEANLKTTFKNITVDNSNKISALWGSYDVACGGIVGQYYPTSGQTSANKPANGGVHFENCHVSAQMDVYNDVCANYQYYAYRYTGMLIGSVRENVTIDGHSYPKMDGITAENSTVHFGTWNDYYYCEIIDNTTASYTHDYQMSRLTEIKAIDGTTITYLDGTTGTVPASGRANYVIVDYTKGHGTENATCYHFKDSAVWTHDMGGIQTGIDENGDGQDDLKEDKQHIYLEFNNLVTGYGWGVTTKGVGDLAGVTILDREVADSVEKFESKFTGDFLYRVGNKNTVSVGSLFQVIKDFDANKGSTSQIAVKDNSNVWVTVEALNDDMDVSGTFTANTTNWTKGTIQFSGTGVVKVTIQDYIFCTPTVLYLEVVDAVNATSATSAKSNNVVLLNDVGFSTIEVSGGYTLYGNGFKMTATSDPMYDTMRAGFVTLDNGTLDNVQVICPNFSYAIIYNSQIKESGNTAVPTDSSNDARGNVRSAVMVTGNSKIVNSYVHGGRAAIFLRSGNLVVDGSTISGGAAANIHALSAQSLTLRNATLIQKPFQATVHDTSKTLMGFSGLFECDEAGISTPLILEGTLVQDAWVNESYIKYTPSAASSVVETALKKTDYLHDLDGDDKNESLNLGFTYIPQDIGGKTNTDNITDNRTNKADIPYGSVEVSVPGISAKVYSYKNTNSTNDDFKNVGAYAPTAQGATAPTVSFTDTNADRVFETKFDANDGRWESHLTVSLDNGNYDFSFDKLLAQKYGKDLTYTVTTADGTEVDTSKTISLNTSGVTEYILTITESNARSTDNVIHTVYFILTATKKTIPEPVKLTDPNGTHYLVVKSKNSDWSCAINALDGAQIKYYDANGQEQTLDLSTLVTTSDKGKLNGTNNTWTKIQNGYTLKITCGVIHDTKSVYGMPVAVNGKLYFTISSTNGYVSTGTSARSVTLTYEFTDPNGKTLTFSKTTQFKYADYKNGTQYSYSDFVNGNLKEASSGGGCVTPDTLITLADGSQKPISQVTYADQILVWDFVSGKYVAKSSSIVMNHGYDLYDVVTLTFDDGTTVNTINGHGFFDVQENKFVILGKDNVEQYIGHSFVKDADKMTTAKLVSYSVNTEYTESWSVLTSEQYNCILEGMLTITPAEVEGSTEFLMPYEIGADMKYDKAKMQADIEKYGLYTYEDFADYCTYEQFVALGLENFKVSVAKGYITWDEIIFLLNLHMN